MQEKIKKLIFYFLKLFIFIFVLSSIIYASLSYYASKKEKEVLYLWKKEGVDLVQKRSEIIKKENNKSAVELIEIANKIALGRKSQSCDIRNSSVFNYLKEQLKKERLEFIYPEESATKRLNEIENDLLKVSEIVKNQRPIWKRENNSFDASSYILSVIDLTRLLSAETLYFLSQGKKEGAINLLNAQISLAESVESRSIIDSIVLTSCYRNIYGCSKFFPYLDDDIVAKLSSFDPIKSTKEGFVFEAAESYSLFDAGYIEKSGKGAKFFPYFYSRPYLRLEHYEYLRFYLMGIKVVEKENPCELKDKEITENIIKEMPKWAIISKIAMPNWRDAWVRSYRLKIEKDLTLLALKAKEEKNKKGSFPESLSLNETICPNTSYKYIKNGDKIKIFFDGNFKADEKSAFVPLSWEE